MQIETLAGREAGTVPTFAADQFIQLIQYNKLVLTFYYKLNKLLILIKCITLRLERNMRYNYIDRVPRRYTYANCLLPVKSSTKSILAHMNTIKIVDESRQQFPANSYLILT